MYSIAVYDWSQITTPANLSQDNLTYDQDANDPAQAGYDPGQPSWTDQTYTYQGGRPTKIKIIDDDNIFEDGSAETGSAAILAEDVTINGVTYAAGSVVENEFALVDGSGARVYVLRIDGQNVGFAPQSPYYVIPAGVSFTPTEGRSAMAADSSDGLSSSTAYSGVICFAPRTRIATPDGFCPAGRLRPGDLVLTADRGAQPLTWVARTEVRFDGTAEGAGDAARPVLIRRGALGPGLPARPLLLSPQHRLLLTGDSLQGDPDAQGQLAPVCGLLPLPGLRIMRGLSRMRYVHLFLDHHALLCAEGVAAESFYPGPMALQALAAEDRARLEALLPPGGYGAPARPLLRPRIATDLARAQRSTRGGALTVAAFDTVTPLPDAPETAPPVQRARA